VTESNRHIVELGVAFVHLVSGEDLIGRVEYDAENKVYSLDRPVTPLVQPKLDESGLQVGASIALVPYRSFLNPDEPLLIRDQNVLFTGKLTDGLEKHYTSVTSGTCEPFVTLT
jgi:hypothetical protein